MTLPVIKTAFVTGELSPDLSGRVDLEKYSSAAATFRNGYVNYRGGYNSRAGLAFVGYSKQTSNSIFLGTTAPPPKLIPFKFSVQQGLVLEFGEEYMRVISQGAYVTESAIAITGITAASPAVLSISVSGAGSATSNNGGVVSSYVPGEGITLAGGFYYSPAVLGVVTTTLIGVNPKNPGTGYAPADTVTLAGGVSSPAPVVTISKTQLGALPTIASAGIGGTPGPVVLTGTTGTGTKFQVQGTIGSGGALASIGAISVAGAYTVNPTTLTGEPVTGGGLTGTTLSIQMGIAGVTIPVPGVFTTNAPGGSFSQASTSGTGIGATFWFGLFAPNTLAIFYAGNYVSFPSNPVSQLSTTGRGAGATFNVAETAGAAFATGDWVYLEGLNEPAALNGRTVVLTKTGVGTYSMSDIFGNPIDTTSMPAYISGGTASRIYTLSTPYTAVDLPYLKKTQSADVMSLTCWNQQTLTEYAPYDLTRFADDSWALIPINTVPATPAPLNLNNSPTVAPGAADGTYYITYYVTAVDASTNEESLPSNYIIAYNTFLGASNTDGVTGSNNLYWDQVPNAGYYNIYAETPVPTVQIVDIVIAGQPEASNVPQPTFIAGLIGQSQTTSFTDPGIQPDFSTGLPAGAQPFARGVIIGGTVTNGGAGFYNLLAPTPATINTTTGFGAKVLPGIIVPHNSVGSLVIENGGANYGPDDTVTINGTGTGAAAMLEIGPESGTYPGTVSYFQQRRVYANTKNNTDTYWMSQPGRYLNFDTSFPSVSSDSIDGSPWSVEVNGIQWMIDMPGGLVVLTGSSAWQLTGSGGSSLNPVPITPSSQQAQPQAFNGASPIIEPIKIDWQILYVQSKGAIVREFTYQIYQNIYTGIDLTELSSHLFTGFQIQAWDYAEEPYKVIWSVRDDGVMLSCTYVKAESVWGWARHDTQGQFVSVASITELPIDAVYVATLRFPEQAPQTGVYMVERMDNRFWNTAEDVFAVDAGLSLPQNYPAATVFASSATGTGTVGVDAIVSGGSGYSAGVMLQIIDDIGHPGGGTGASGTLTLNNGIIVGATIVGGNGYTNPKAKIVDPAGSAGGAGGMIALSLTNLVTFTASAAVFSAQTVGQFLRMGGGIAEITKYTSPTSVMGNLLTPIAAMIPNTTIPAAQHSGSWTLNPFTTEIGGLTHLIGFEVTGLGDGNVIPPQTVAADGTISLAALPNGGASVVNIGLAFTAQVQSVNVDGDQPTIQGRRKAVKAVTGRVVQSRGMQAGQNQPNGSEQSPLQIAPAWYNMDAVPDKGVPSFNALCQPLYSGDVRVPLKGGYGVPGQVAFQQTQPLPMNLNAFILELDEGDLPQVGEPKAQSNQMGGGRQ
jgi:hypothetical protein